MTESLPYETTWTASTRPQRSRKGATKGNVPGKPVARLLRASLARIGRVRASTYAFLSGPRDRDLNLLCYCVGAPQTKLTHALPRGHTRTRAGAHARPDTRRHAHTGAHGTRTHRHTHAQGHARTGAGERVRAHRRTGTGTGAQAYRHGHGRTGVQARARAHRRVGTGAGAGASGRVRAGA